MEADDKTEEWGYRGNKKNATVEGGKKGSTRVKYMVYIQTTRTQIDQWCA